VSQQVLSQDPCQGCDSCLFSTHDEQQTRHIHSKQDGGVKSLLSSAPSPVGTTQVKV